MKRLFLLVLAMIMLCAANAQGKDKTYNEQLGFGGFGWSGMMTGDLMVFYGLANWSSEDLTIRVQIRELGYDSTVVIPAYTIEDYDIGVNAITFIYEELPQLHITLTSEDPNNYFALRFVYWGKKLHREQNRKPK